MAAITATAPADGNVTEDTESFEDAYRKIWPRLSPKFRLKFIALALGKIDDHEIRARYCGGGRFGA